MPSLGWHGLRGDAQPTTRLQLGSLGARARPPSDLVALVGRRPLASDHPCRLLSGMTSWAVGHDVRDATGEQRPDGAVDPAVPETVSSVHLPMSRSLPCSLADSVRPILHKLAWGGRADVRRPARRPRP